MKPKALAIGVAAVTMGAFLLMPFAHGQDKKPLVRLAELEIDPVHLQAYKAALREEIEASIRIEPGVSKLYAVAVKDQPNQVRLFEVYADEAAYEAHLHSAHFRKYKDATAGWVRSLKLVETDPILLGTK